MFEISRNRNFCAGFWAIIIFIILLLFLLASFGSKAHGADISPEELQNQIDELRSELAALKNNKLPANIEFCGEHVPQERGYVRERLEKELLTLNRNQFILYIKRAKYKYFPYVERRLKERKMPNCLKYIPIIESALNPNALSSAKAGGFWQFMPSTARKYDLRKNINWDDRADFEKATDAALSYLWDNYKRFGNWALAMAAYNAGEETIESAIRIQKTKDYYNLLLPAETMQYNYRAIVAYVVMSNPERYALSLEESDLYKWPETEEMILKLTKPKHVADIAAELKISLNELLWLNPQVRMPSGKKAFREKLRNFILPKGVYTFKIPNRSR